MQVEFTVGAALTELLSHDLIKGRILSVNKGQSNLTGVMNCGDYFIKFIVDTEMELNRGDLIVFEATVKTFPNGNQCAEITKITEHIPCTGKLPNKQFENGDEINTIVASTFDPHRYAFLKNKSESLKQIRTLLYDMQFAEVQTPTLYNLKSPSSALPFVLKSQKHKDLYLKTIHEHLIKPYFIVGFDKVFEFGKIYRNVFNDSQFDCEFTNLDAWWVGAEIPEIVELCTKIVFATAQSFELEQPEVTALDYYEIAALVGSTDKAAIKHYIAEHHQDGLLFVLYYPLKTNGHIEALDDKCGKELHVYLNGRSFAHGYVLDTQKVEREPGEPDDCQLFEEHLDYGCFNFGGVGIGYEKMIQALCNLENLNKKELYRRRY